MLCLLKILKLDKFQIAHGFVLTIVIGLVGCGLHGHGSWDMKELLDNESVQILDVDFKAGSKTPRHYHREALIYALSDAQVRITGSDDKPVDLSLHANQVLWRNAEMRTLENIGATDLHVLNFDLKEPSKEKKAIAAGDDPLKVAPDTYIQLLDNHRVRVLEATVKSGTQIPMHTHPDSILYFLNDARIKYIFPDGKINEIDQKKGSALWVPARSHALGVLGETTVKFLVVEMKPAS